jgi:hypothetical protein
MTNEIKGEFESGRVWVDGKKLMLVPSLKVFNHSPDGFAWGYASSGPAQLALTVLMVFIDNDSAVRLHQTFKSDALVSLDRESDFTILIDVRHWIEREDKTFSITPQFHNQTVPVS